MSKKSFVLHKDSLLILDKLSDDQSGKIFKAIKQYQNTGTIPNLDFALELVLAPFLNQFKRDQEKYKRSEIGGRIGNLKNHHKEIYEKYLKKEITLDEAEDIAYPHKKEIESCPPIALARPPIAPDQPRSLSVSDSVNVSVSDSVNVSDITITPDKPKKPKPNYNDFQFQIAEQLGNHIKNIKNINLTVGNIKKWANDIRLLQELDLKPRQNSQQDIIKAMQSVLDNTGKEYFPQIESGSSFRIKFIKIENYKQSTKTTKDQQHLDERAALVQHYANQQGESC